MSRVDDELERADVLRNTEQGYLRRYGNLRAAQEPIGTVQTVGNAMEPWEKRHSFRETMEKFSSQYFLSFPQYPCSYCGVLSPFRSTAWMEFSERDAEAGKYGLSSRLGVQLVRNDEGQVAVCSICRKRTEQREAPDIGGWPQVLLSVPQYSRSYLSFVKLNCNLGRTQSHSGQNWHNPYSTYRTLTGTKGRGWMQANEIGKMTTAPNVRAIHLYSGSIGTFLQSEEARSFDLENHNWVHLAQAEEWLRQNNPLIRDLSPKLVIGIDERVAVGALPFAESSRPEEDAGVPFSRPDVIVNPLNFEAQVRNEDYRSHRIPGGVICLDSIGELKRIINHGHQELETLLFPYLYPYGRGSWVYQGPARARFKVI